MIMSIQGVFSIKEIKLQHLVGFKTAVHVVFTDSYFRQHMFFALASTPCNGLSAVFSCHGQQLLYYLIDFANHTN